MTALGSSDRAVDKSSFWFNYIDMKTNMNKTIPSISPQAWQDYLNNNDTVSNQRLRPENVSFWEAMLSEEADFTRTPEGKRIAELIRDL